MNRIPLLYERKAKLMNIYSKNMQEALVFLFGLWYFLYLEESFAWLSYNTQIFLEKLVMK